MDQKPIPVFTGTIRDVEILISKPLIAALKQT